MAVELKGLVDRSWTVCPQCDGQGRFSAELATAGRGGKGEDCDTCGGRGRVHNPEWPPCGCKGEDAHCPACHGLGLLSPERVATLKAGGVHVVCTACGGSGGRVFTPSWVDELPEP